MDDPETVYDMSLDPDREAELHIRVWMGLRSADLTPLATLLRSEFEIEATLRSAIADALEGEGAACRIEAKRKQRGKPVEDESAAMRRDLQIEAFVRHRSLGPRQKKAAIADACAHFNVGRGGIFEARKRTNALRASLPERLKTVLDADLAKFAEK